MRKTDLITMAFVLGLAITAAGAQTSTIRIGPNLRDAEGIRFEAGTTVSQIIEAKGKELGRFVQGISDCRSIVSSGLQDIAPRDDLRQTWTIIQTIRVECWVLQQVNPSSRVLPLIWTDAITPEMSRGIMAYAQTMAAESEEWDKVLITFSGGELSCQDSKECLLFSPDGRNPVEMSLQFALVLAMGRDRFVRVTQFVYGRSSFVYVVLWREDEGGGRVVSFFPEI